MKRTWTWWAGIVGVCSFGALFMGVGVFELCVGYAFSRWGGIVTRSESPVSYWINTGFWFVFGGLITVKALTGYLKDDLAASGNDDSPS
jgi:hypothetical protein